MGEGDPHRGGGFGARDLTVRFGGITALDAVSLDLAPGEVLGVIGPNGAGKTTLFNVICGFVAPTSGTMRWQGRAFAKVRANRLARLGIARTLQGVGLFSGLSVLENVMAGAQRFRRAGVASALLGLPRSDRDERELRERALRALRELGCEDVAARLPATLPYPVQKRVALARALVSEPQLLLLDEPAGGLGAEEVRELGERIRALRGSMAVMLVEHRVDLVMSACDRVVVLDFGRVIAEGEPQSVARDPRVLEAYLGRDAGADVEQAGIEARRAFAGGDERAPAGTEGPR
ncbi:MAG TPA: ABC transporter ATP-binding protein [Solirubrobacteraceae bacterium]|nr:ABC transporter ATP-binding protein [Solirubrobacteraceae bacterium]